MSKKEIWYIWSGRGNLSVATKLKLKGGQVINKDSFSSVAAFKRFKRLGGFDTVAYSLGETRERVRCGKCGGYGLIYGGEIFMLVDGESIPNFITESDCPDYKSLGYIWKRGEKK